jgi:hypothetical protein
MKATMISAWALAAILAGPAMAGGRPAVNHRAPSASQPAPAPAGMPSFYQPARSIDDKEWWKPNPYFQSNGQGFGYPTRPVRPYAGYWTEPDRR